MIKHLKSLTVWVIAFVNILVVAAMVVLGYSGHIDPSGGSYLPSMGVAFPIFLIANVGFLAFWTIFKFRMALIPVAGFAIACIPVRIYMPLNFSDEIPGGAIKVMSYNIKWFYGAADWDESAEVHILEYIGREQPDILCLQEDGTPHHKNFYKDSKLFPYCSNTLYEPWEDRRGLTLYSKYPILKKERIEYESKGNGSCAYYLDIDGVETIVINNHFESNHLSLDQRKKYAGILKGEVRGDTAEAEGKKMLQLLADAGRIRAPQADAVAKYVREHSDKPIILCGDFNDSPLSYTNRVLSEELADCYVETGTGPGISYNRSGFWVRIDNIMCSRHFTPYACVVDNNIDASDHYPIYCWLKMSHKR